MTFSVAAHCAESGMFGVIVSSSSPCVAARCAHARAGAGAVLSQNITDPALGTRVLDLMALGASAMEAVDIVQRDAPHMQYRQLIAVDGADGAAIFTGDEALGRRGEAKGPGVASAGNLLADEAIPRIMVEHFLASQGHLGDRLLSAMLAGVEAGGEEGPIHSAGMKLVWDMPWPVADLRVDWSESCPLRALQDLWRVYEPQLEDYVTRARNPTAAPSYGVPGDD